MLKIGIVGLPNSGKSTLFNALIKSHQAQVAAHPFTTIEPNIGIVEVPDEKLETLVHVLGLRKKIPATIEFVDIAGLVAGAHKGEGLGNKFLANIRECDAILHLIRMFDSASDPESDLEVINTELYLKDLETIKKALEEKKIDEEKRRVLTKLIETIDQDKPAKDANLNQEELVLTSELNLLSQKPVLYVANVSEEQLGKAFFNLPNEPLIISAKLESELIDLLKEERREYLKQLGEYETGLEKIIKASYKALHLITFYTLLPDQVQAWPIAKGISAKETAGKVHTDFENKFIQAEVINFSDLIKYKSWQQAKEKGKIRTEGKEYLISDGDVLYFKHA